ncbi:MAG: hypothetical protein A2655_03115 [Candidatus Yanofskybacteria bacterium RIFCSPHIGHO2_01_FULL_43_42]|uniref:Sigma-54 factor interaction domain-containing protein n=1 Tax=Candidatus Yanofskybacteria bacterium RIFCSPLOWO2_01_FULL_43_22 TaxID=1802695 RepID=A0A1F8GGT3_9BACT|nr:MAG: hypothetical protein A2655_03115 [Candidatus Yanofskybacteria bacterium RIFCSPHIGHO2_01_FULL_43_42]OGN12991.1 MAG: hypothetical protein A3D48_03775 [Candidatus Yanofskybacteria bacterium RIFCSPHIGHO2_02_FULL_43_17]OGN23928.1 MAG: hypothetical protein A3A13_02480 [Candidatus Yanofskybacteria bacterium RIFCSPLOWO2_01_FULL_43_22]
MIFDFEKSAIYKAVLFFHLFPAGVLKFCRIMFFVLGSIPIGLFLVNMAYPLSLQIHLGWAMIAFPLGLSTLFFELFGSYFLKYPKIKSTGNIADLLEYQAARVFEQAFKFSRSFGEKELSVRTLLVAMLEDNVMDKLFTRIIPTYKVVERQLKETLTTPNPSVGGLSVFVSRNISPDVHKLLEEALVLRDKHGSKRISVLDIMAAMFDYDENFKNFIVGQDLDKNDLEELADWYEHIWAYWREGNKFWSLENLLRQPPIGRDWVFGFARYLKVFAANLTDKMEYSRPIVRLIFRSKEIEQIEQILVRSGQNNVLLVGEEGVGRERIILDLAELIARGKALPQLNFKQVFDLNLSLIVGSSKSINDVQNLLTAVLNEAVKAGNIVLILRDFHNFIGEIGGLGRIDVTEVLVPYLRSSHIQIIATTNPGAFHKFIEGRSELTEVFERINVFEPDAGQTLKMIQELVPAIEANQGVVLTFGAIKQIVQDSDKFIRTSPFPEKAFDLLSEVVSYSISSNRRIVTKTEVSEVVSRKTGIPLGPIIGDEKEKLVRLEEIMHQELIGQDRAVEVVASTMRRLRIGLAKRGKPAGVFLFVGPTGVGKTLTAKILAKTYFGSADRMLRFDMSEYQDTDSLDRFIGSIKANEPGRFVTEVRDNPFSLILLDELEKANKNVLNIFLQVFDEGRLTDVFGRKINFEQNIIIATSNAGADLVRDLVRQGLDPSLEKERLVDMMIQGKHFSPEFLNRFDEIVIFHPLSQDQVGKITELLLANLAARMKEQGYEFMPTPEIADYIAKAGFDPQFGARPMERVIRDKVESAIATKILDGSIRKGEGFSLTVEDLK